MIRRAAREGSRFDGGLLVTVYEPEVRMRAGRAVIGVAAVLGGLCIAGALASGAGASSTPTGGHVQVFYVPAGHGSGKVVIAGAIGDYGTGVNTDADGKPDPNGDHAKLTLTKGTFVVDAVTLDVLQNKATPAFDPATCSAVLSTTAPVKLLDGTGLYAGISGTVDITASGIFVLPRYKTGKHKGQCDGNANPAPGALFEVLHGKGTVQFG